MSHTSALEYAQSIAQQITERTNAGYPFGVEHIESGKGFYDMGEALAEFPNSSDSDFTGASPAAYLDGMLDIQYLVSYDKSYRAARVCIALGGPSAWINTHTLQIEAAWWSETVYVDLPASFCEQIDEWLEEYYNCI